MNLSMLEEKLSILKNKCEDYKEGVENGEYTVNDFAEILEDLATGIEEIRRELDPELAEELDVLPEVEDLKDAMNEQEQDLVSDSGKSIREKIAEIKDAPPPPEPKDMPPVEPELYFYNDF